MCATATNRAQAIYVEVIIYLFVTTPTKCNAIEINNINVTIKAIVFFMM